LAVVKRPSFPTVIAFVALFVALGGPAQAARFIDGTLLRKGSVNSKAVKDRSLKVRDLSRKAVRDLKTPRHMSVTEAKLANGSVTPGKLALGAVGSPAIADRSIGAVDLMTGAVTGAHLADGMLAAQDVGRFYGRFETRIGVDPATGQPDGIRPHSCWAGDPAGLWPEDVGADISDDLVLVSTDDRWPRDTLSLTVRGSGRSRFTLVACNASGRPVPAQAVGFRYLVIDLP
jgi:hypothetical protein